MLFKQAIFPSLLIGKGLCNEYVSVFFSGTLQDVLSEAIAVNGHPIECTADNRSKMSNEMWYAVTMFQWETVW